MSNQRHKAGMAKIGAAGAGVIGTLAGAGHLVNKVNDGAYNYTNGDKFSGLSKLAAAKMGHLNECGCTVMSSSVPMIALGSVGSNDGKVKLPIKQMIQDAGILHKKPE